jgi:protease-4
MSLDSDVIVDRRRIRRKLTFWRVAAAVVAIAAIGAVGMIATGRGSLTGDGSIARINIEGLIRSDQERVEALERLEKSQAAAVIVHINSPGGTTAGSEQLYDALVRLKAKKPLVVVVEGLPRRAVISQRLPPTASSPSRARWSVRSACCSSFRISPSF